MSDGMTGRRDRERARVPKENETVNTVKGLTDWTTRSTTDGGGLLSKWEDG